MKMKFDTTIKAERMKALKKLVKKYGFSAFQYNTGDEIAICKEGVFYMNMENQGTYSADVTLCCDETGKTALFVHK